MHSTQLARGRPELVPLGETGLLASRLGVGLAALGRPGYMTLHHRQDLGGRYEPEAMEARAHAVLDAAYARGVRYIDVARSYGRGEAFVASWLGPDRRDRDAVVVASKWGYTYTADWRADADTHEVKDHSLTALRRQMRESQDQLGAHLSLYQIHSVTADSTVLRDAPVIDMLADLRATGVRVGLTVSGDRQAPVIRAALDVERAGKPVFDVVQATWNLLERGAESALREAHEAGVGVVVKEVLANGRLVGLSVDPRLAGPLQRLRATARELQTTADAVAIAAALARPWADVVLVGPASVPHLESNLGALALSWDESLDALLEPLTMSSAEYWRMRRGFTWN
jgi:aryl-alcohol dehydrogenase-like predicted oxidoreductase